MVHQSLTMGDGIEACMRTSNTWQALTTLVRIGTRQGVTAYAASALEVKLTLLSVNLHPKSPLEEAVVCRWIGKRALELARNMEGVLQARGNAPALMTDYGPPALHTHIAGKLELWVDLVVLGDLDRPFAVNYILHEVQ